MNLYLALRRTRFEHAVAGVRHQRFKRENVAGVADAHLGGAIVEVEVERSCRNCG